MNALRVSHQWLPQTNRRRLNGAALAQTTRRQVKLNKRARGGPRNVRLPFSPPETWHEPKGNGRGYRVIVQSPGEGYRHVVTPDEVRQRLSLLPAKFVASLEVIQFSRMTRKKQSFPCYGMQWGAAIYLYPLEVSLTEQYDRPPRPEVLTETKMFGGRWENGPRGSWNLVWTETALKDFYLNNILIHELGHLIDARNNNYTDRERFAEWFAIEYGYRPTRRSVATS